MSQSELSPGGVTWEAAMTRASEILLALPVEERALTRGGTVNRPEYIGARVAMAQAWIGFARELTSRERAKP